MKKGHLVLSRSIKLSSNGGNEPRELSKSYQDIRKLNTELNLNGLFILVKGGYISIIEGDFDSLQEYHASLNSNPNYIDSSYAILPHTENSHFFTTRLSLVHDINESSLFKLFIEAKAKDLQDKNPELLAEISRFGFKNSNLPELAIPSEKENNNKTSTLPKASMLGKNLSMTRWPDFTLITPSLYVIEVCAKLVDRHMTFEQLIQSVKDTEQSIIETLLFKFEAMGVLTISPIDGHLIEKEKNLGLKETEKSMIQDLDISKNDSDQQDQEGQGFYNKMRSLFSKG